MRARTVREVPSWRFTVLAAALALLGLVLVGRLFALQVLDTERGYRFLQSQGDARALRLEPLPAHRGIISDRNGEPLAVSTPVQTLSANPKLLAPQVEDWVALATALGQSPEDLRRRVAAHADKDFMYLRRRMSPDDAARVLALG